MQFVVLIAIVLTASTCLESARLPLAPKDRLTSDLLKNYQPAVDPGNIELSFGVAFLCAKYDQTTDSVVSSVWEKHFWQDTRLSWNPLQYDGVQSIRVPAKLIWTPDTTLYHSTTSFVERADVNVVIESNGKVTWIPTATYRSLCLGDKNEAVCSWRIGSWTYDGINVALKASGTDPIDLTNYNVACPSVIDSHSAEVVSHIYPGVAEPYPSLDITFTLKARQSSA